MKLYFVSIVAILLLALSCKNEVNKQKTNSPINKARIRNPIPIDKRVLSGLDLKPVKNQNDPERRLFQKQLFRGSDISVYVVSSETATAIQDNYSMEEFLYLLNGRARLNPNNGDESLFNTGDFFVAPKGFSGEWETIGGDEFLIELSVISTQRSEKKVNPKQTLPVLLDKRKISGIDINSDEGSNKNRIKDELYDGEELSVHLFAEKPDSTYIIKTPVKEQLNYVISGAITLHAEGGDEFTFYRGDFFILPKGFVGTKKTMGHGLFRYMSVTKSEKMHL